LAWARRRGRWEIYALCGLMLALGLLTYDTVLPMVGVVSVLLIADLSRSTAVDLARRLRPTITVVVPVLGALFLLTPYLMSRAVYYDVGGKGWLTQFPIVLERNLGHVLWSWLVSTGA